MKASTARPGSSGLEAQAADALVDVGELGGHFVGAGAQVGQGGRLFEQRGGLAVGGLGAVVGAGLLGQGAQVEGDGHAGRRPVLEPRARRRLLQRRRRLVAAVQRAQVARQEQPRVEVVGLQLDHLAGDGQGVVVAVQRQVQRHQGAADGRRVGVEPQRLLVGAQGLGQALTAFVLGGQAVELDGLGPVQVAPRRRSHRLRGGAVADWPLGGGRGQQEQHRQDRGHRPVHIRDDLPQTGPPPPSPRRTAGRMSLRLYRRCAGNANTTTMGSQSPERQRRVRHPVRARSVSDGCAPSDARLLHGAPVADAPGSDESGGREPRLWPVCPPGLVCARRGGKMGRKEDSIHT